MKGLPFLGMVCVSAILAEQIEWETKTGFRDLGRIRVADGLVLTGNITGRGGTTLFDAATGKLLWRVGGQQRGGPLPGKRVVFTANHGMGVSALDVKTGKPLWQAPEFMPANFVDLMHDGNAIYSLSQRGKLWALDPATGKLRWEHVHKPGDQNGGCLSTPVAGEGLVIYGGGTQDVTKGLIWGLDPATGKEVWRSAVACAAGMAVEDGIVAVTSNAQMGGLDARTGSEIWRTPPAVEQVDERTYERSLTAPAIWKGRVYAIHELGLTGWNLKTGNKEFEFTGNFPSSERPRTLEVVDGRAYFIANFEEPRSSSNREGFLYGLDLSTQKIVLRHRVNRDVPYMETWGTRYFKVDGGFVYYENAGLLVKLHP